MDLCKSVIDSDTDLSDYAKSESCSEHCLKYLNTVNYVRFKIITEFINYNLAILYNGQTA